MRQPHTWLIADTHFFHDKMARECNWPENHEQHFLARCRYLMAPQDTLIHLGDVIFYQYLKLKGMMDSMPGRKVLVMGNHDNKSRGWYMRNGFDFACDALSINGCLLSHEPIEAMEEIPAGWNVHGHCHHTDPCEQYEWYCPGYHIKLDPAAMNFEPVRMDLLLGGKA